jgi:hypothetical protein
LSRSRCSEGGFDLWLGDKGIVNGKTSTILHILTIDKLEGVENFRAWKYRIGLILEENDLARFVKEEVLEPDDDADKAKHQKDIIRAKRIIVDSIKDQLIP